MVEIINVDAPDDVPSPHGEPVFGICTRALFLTDCVCGDGSADPVGPEYLNRKQPRH